MTTSSANGATHTSLGQSPRNKGKIPKGRKPAPQFL
jgi:hypothetical protein